MSTIRAILRQRKAELQAAMQAAMHEAAERAAIPFRAELKDVETALYALEMADVQTNAAPELGDQILAAPARVASVRQAKRSHGLTLKQMILEELQSHYGGQDALSILAAINERWDLDLARTSLSPQLSRLKAEGKIKLNGKVWSLVDKDETPGAETPGARTEGAAGSPAESAKHGLTGSIPVASTNQSLFHDQIRKEDQ